MTLRLEDRTGHTIIRVSQKEFTSPTVNTYVIAQVAIHGGREVGRTSKSIYFEIYADILNL